MDTTKNYYEDSEAPAYQVQITNGVETHVPWAEVPPLRRYFIKYDDPPGFRPKVRVPIVKVTMVSLDEKGQPVPPEKAYSYHYVEEGLNPAHKRHGQGGRQR